MHRYIPKIVFLEKLKRPINWNGASVYTNEHVTFIYSAM